ncbi:ABC transporter substrate-binding protein [Subtercola lobariae]|uniref:ABC transporter substrate-binding protein n=1 Tax=Subtercola lobariae TaxID=1588641 RepID=A0A917F0W9_9MICO|nr:ABC transporter substrate-binding protein [Subtercola lobariae]GGF31790.1 ABC transporter substrate-binding protein [Subtercola lobariae]
MRLKIFRDINRSTWRRRSVVVGVSLAILGATAACSTSASAGASSTGEAPAGTIQLVVGAPAAILAVPTFAVDQGFFKAEGLDVKVSIVTAAQVPTALAGDTAQFVVGAAPGPDAAALKAPIKILGTYADKPNMEFLLGNGVSSVADLKGKSVGISAPGEIVDILAKQELASAGLAPGDVTFVSLGSFQAVSAAFQSGQVQGVVVSSLPTGATLLASTPGSSVGYDFSKSTPFTLAGLYANTDWTSAHPDATQKLVNALNKAVMAWWSDPTDAQATLKTFANSQNPAVDYAGTLTVMTKTLEPVTAATQIPALQALHDNGHPDVNPQDWAKYVDNTYVNQLK